MRILGYIRDSNTPGYSVEEQKNSIEAWCERVYGKHIDKYFIDDIPWGSVHMSERPLGSDMLDMAASGDVIISLTLDRAFISIQQAVELIDELLDRKIIFNVIELGYELESEMGELMYDSCKTWVKFDSAIKSERIKERVTNGRPKNGCSPIGYKIIRSEGQSHFVPDDKERRLVLELTEWKDAEGISWSEAVRRMQKKGTRYNGHRWNQTNTRVAYQAGLDGFPGFTGQKDGFTIIDEAKKKTKKIANTDNRRRRLGDK